MNNAMNTQNFNKSILDISDYYFKDSNLLEIFKTIDNNFPDKEIVTSFHPGKLPEHKVDFTQRIKIDSAVTLGMQNLTRHKYIDLLFNLGKLSISLGEFILAKDLFHKIVDDPNKDLNFNNYEANSLYNLAKIKALQAEWKECVIYLEKAKSLFLINKDNIGLTDYYLLMGNMYLNQGSLDKAKNVFELGSTFIDHIDDKYFLGLIDNNIGIIYASQNKFDDASTHFYRALSYQQQLNNDNKISEIRNNLGLLLTLKDELDNAVNEFDLSIESGIKNNYLTGIVMAYINKATVYCRIKDFNFATAYSNKAMELAIRLNDRLTIADVYKVKGMIERELNNFDTSENMLQTSLRLNNEIGNKYNYSETAFEIGLLYKEWQKNDLAVKYLKESLEYYNSISAERQIHKIELLLDSIV
jgi:tetratricopeptide (TPR) repeat protein